MITSIKNTNWFINKDIASDNEEIITDIKRRAINKIVISSMFEDYELQTTIIERK